MSKKLQEKQRRRLEEERRRAERRKAARRRNVITSVLAVLVLAGVVYLIVADRTAQSTSNNAAGDLKNGVSQDAAGCDPIKSVTPMKGVHIEVGAKHAPYNTNPPTSGPHYPPPVAPIDPGFYSNDIEPEKVVHNLEHGEIVIWYKPDAPQSTIDDIQKVTEQQPAATVAVPWNDIASGKELVLTAWGHLQPCVEVSQDVVDHFRTLYQGKGPEQVGIPTFNG